MSIGSNIRRLREAQGLTQELLAEKLDVSFQAVSSWERDEYLPETSKLIKLAAALNVSVSAILEERSGLFKTKDEIYDWSHMKTYIKTTARNLKLQNTLTAVDFAVEKHEGQRRKRASVPYIAHPFTLACHALAMGFADDEIVAACILHDVVEDCKVRPEELPVSEEIRDIVKLLSHGKTTDEDRDQVMSAYYGAMLGNPKAAKSLWTIFASANQLLASLTLLAATLWFVRNKKPCWFTLVPMCFMLSVSSYALISIFMAACGKGDWTRVGATGFLILTAVALVLFTLSKVFGRGKAA